MSDEDLICICMTVTRKEIENAVNDGHKTVEALKSVLFCCTGCGTCESRVQKVIDDTLTKNTASSELSPKN
ncbi:MAG: (2Fe-2S)-binding protein [Oligoflexia bacterium]|nr:(2Fe-2S)-binding protein [Oligoflexia bacterium]